MTSCYNRAITTDEKEDIISSLPEFLLIHILSFLEDTKETVKTCVLSKRWKFVWTHSLEISVWKSSKDDENLGRFMDYVGKMISMCRYLNKFTFHSSYKNHFASNVDHLVYSAIQNEVKDINLSFYQESDFYELPQMLYSYSSLSNLFLSHCRLMAPLGIIQWRCLESLKFWKMELLDCVMGNILSNCPRLKTLRIYYCWGLNYLKIDSPNLTTLVIGRGGDENVLDISAPYLRVLNITGTCSYRLTNVSSVVEAYIELTEWDDRLIKMNHMKHLLERLRSVEILELGTFAFEAISALEIKSWKFPSYTNLLKLTVEHVDHEMSLHGILAILRTSTNLQTLHIERELFPEFRMEMVLDEYEIRARDCNKDFVSSHMKFVKIDRFTETEHMLTLVQILLKGSMVLEKMVITYNNGPSSGTASIDSTESAKGCLPCLKRRPKVLSSYVNAKRLHTFPRASSKAVLELR